MFSYEKMEKEEREQIIKKEVNFKIIINYSILIH
jgi:hypothetical protein